MIRRTFWVMVGAALGIAGYRRLSRLVNAGRGRQAGSAALLRTVRGGRTRTGGFLRDVRTGMAEYMDRHGDA